METREIAQSPKHRKTSRKYWGNGSLLGDKLKNKIGSSMKEVKPWRSMAVDSELGRTYIYIYT